MSCFIHIHLGIGEKQKWVLCYKTLRAPAIIDLMALTQVNDMQVLTDLGQTD